MNGKVVGMGDLHFTSVDEIELENCKEMDERNGKVVFGREVFGAMPDEMFVEILGFLDADDIFCVIKKVNRRLYTLCKEEIIWRHLCYSKEYDPEFLHKENSEKTWRSLFFSLCSWILKNNHFYVRPGLSLGPRVRRTGKQDAYRSILCNKIFSFGKHSVVYHVSCVPTYKKVIEFKKYRKGKSKKASKKVPTFGQICVGFIIFREDKDPESIIKECEKKFIGFDELYSRGQSLNLEWKKGSKKDGKKDVKMKEWIVKLMVDLDLNKSQLLIKTVKDSGFRRIKGVDLFESGRDFGRGISFGVSLKYSSDTVTLLSCV